MSYQGPADTIKDSEVFRELQLIAQSMGEVGRMRVLYREPLRPRDGMFCVCDGVIWNPIGDGIKRPIWFDEAAGLWKVF